MIFSNVKIYGTDFRFHHGEVEAEDGLIKRVTYYEDGSGSDYLIPGLIDLHFHGAMGCDICDGSEEAFDRIARYELFNGITSICPATLTLPAETLEKILICGRQFAEKADQRAARLVGFNMEGPFISPVKKGAQNERYIRPADIALAERFLEVSGGLVKLMGLAPEENPDFEAFIKALKDRVILTLAHTNADYDTAAAAIFAGVRHAVHLYNAMSGPDHKAPGVVGAVVDSEKVTAELICDGNHVHPAAVRAAFRLLGASRIVLISDSLRAAGMPDGSYELGGQETVKSGARCTLKKTGALAGSVSNLFDCMLLAVKEMGIPLEDAVRSATEVPARVLGILDRVGVIAPGRQADLLLLSRTLERKEVVHGQEVFYFPPFSM